MTHFFGPTQQTEWSHTSIDTGFLRALTALGGDFHVFVEFHLPSFQRNGRRVAAQPDFLVFEADRPFRALLIEHKRIAGKIVHAPVNGQWQVISGGKVVGCPGVENPCQQTERIADAVQDWLRKHAEELLGARPTDPVSRTIRVSRLLVVETDAESCRIETPAFMLVSRSAANAVSTIRSASVQGAVDVLGADGIERAAALLGLTRKTRINGVALDPTPSGSTISIRRDVAQQIEAGLRRVEREASELRALIAGLSSAPGSGPTLPTEVEGRFAVPVRDVGSGMGVALDCGDAGGHDAASPGSDQRPAEIAATAADASARAALTIEEVLHVAASIMEEKGKRDGANCGWLGQAIAARLPGFRPKDLGARTLPDLLSRSPRFRTFREKGHDFVALGTEAQVSEAEALRAGVTGAELGLSLVR